MCRARRHRGQCRRRRAKRQYFVVEGHASGGHARCGLRRRVGSDSRADLRGSGRGRDFAAADRGQMRAGVRRSARRHGHGHGCASAPRSAGIGTGSQPDGRFGVDRNRRNCRPADFDPHAGVRAGRIHRPWHRSGQTPDHRAQIELAFPGAFRADRRPARRGVDSRAPCRWILPRSITARSAIWISFRAAPTRSDAPSACPACAVCRCRPCEWLP